jgi:hypothetical protein
MTINDPITGKNYYEIYIRRERDQSDDTEDYAGPTVSSGNATFSAGAADLKGLNTFCLVAREEIPANLNNLFHFADVDRDAMVDMIFFSKNDMSINVYFNKL